MAVVRTQEQSVLASLAELREIEEQRVADERAAVREAAQAKEAAAAAELRVAHEAQLALETARLEAAREARLKIEAIEATERTRQHAILAESRLAQEMALRRADVARRRPTWMVAVTAIAILAAFGLIYVAIDRTRASELAKQRERIAVQQKREMKHEVEEMSASLATIEAELAVLSKKTTKALDDLAKANTPEKRAAAATTVKQLRDQTRVLENRAPKKPPQAPIKIDPKCLTNALC